MVLEDISFDNKLPDKPLQDKVVHHNSYNNPVQLRTCWGNSLDQGKLGGRTVPQVELDVLVFSCTSWSNNQPIRYRNNPYHT